MKKLFVLAALATGLLSCGNEASENGPDTDTINGGPSAIEDETKHPSGVTNQNVISTDTAAMNVDAMHDTTGK